MDYNLFSFSFPPHPTSPPPFVINSPVCGNTNDHDNNNNNNDNNNNLDVRNRSPEDPETKDA